MRLTIRHDQGIDIYDDTSDAETSLSVYNELDFIARILYVTIKDDRSGETVKSCYYPLNKLISVTSE